MPTKRKTKLATTPDAKTPNVKDNKSKSRERKMAEVLLSPTIINAITVQSFVTSFGGEVDLNEAITIMHEKSDKIIGGDLSELESTLTAQAVSLNAIFNTLARRSALNIGEYITTVEVYMRLALKAQAQCARTIEVLAAIKNPPVIFAKQANIAHGHQQVNNGTLPHAGKNINSSNELLSEANHAPVDTRGTIETSRTNQAMATVETFNRCEDTRRQSNIKPECI